MARTVYYVAVSVDGFIADRDGGVGWLDAYSSPELGYDAFLAQVGAVVIGRSTYEQMLTFGPWPYEGRDGLIVTSRPLPSPPPRARPVTIAELPAAVVELCKQTSRDVWIVGGGQTARECLSAGLIDELELYVIPTLLGTGIPLLSHHASSIPLRLIDQQVFSGGVTRLRYAVEKRAPLPHGSSLASD